MPKKIQKIQTLPPRGVVYTYSLYIYIYIYMVRVPPEIYLRMFSYLEDMIKKIEEAFDIHEGSPDE